MTSNNWRRFGIGAAVTAFWLGVWTLVCVIANQKLLMPLPYPWDVATALADLLPRGDFWADVAFSLLRIVFGFAAAVATLLLAELVVPILPYLLAFSAGAMLYVVVEELIPEMSEGEHSHVGTIFFAVGFTLMMVLDVALG